MRQTEGCTPILRRQVIREEIREEIRNAIRAAIFTGKLNPGDRSIETT